MLAESLKDLMDKLRAKILDLKSDMFPKSGPLSLQGRMLNQVGANGQGSGSLHLSFQGQKLVSFQFEKDTVIVHSEDRAMELQWENASEVTGFLKKFFTGELKRLIDNISEFLEKLPQTTAAPSTAPGTVTAPSNAIAASPLTRNNLMKIPILGLAIFVVICCYLCCFTGMLQKEKSSSSSTPQTGSASVSSHSSAEMLENLCILEMPSPAGGVDGPGDAASSPLCPSSAHSDP